MSSNWRDFTVKCLDVALDYFELTDDSNVAVFASEVMDYLFRVAKEADSNEKEAKKVEKASEIREPKFVEAPKVVKESIEYVDELDIPEYREYTKHTIDHTKTKGHTNKSISDRFAGAVVYIGDRHRNGIQDSLAEIVKGATVGTGEVKDYFKLLKTGETLTMTEYLTKFNVTDCNYARVRFTENPRVSFWMIKAKYYNDFQTMDDVRAFGK